MGLVWLIMAIHSHILNKRHAHLIQINLLLCWCHLHCHQQEGWNSRNLQYHNLFSPWVLPVFFTPSHSITCLCPSLWYPDCLLLQQEYPNPLGMLPNLVEHPDLVLPPFPHFFPPWLSGDSWSQLNKLVLTRSNLSVCQQCRILTQLIVIVYIMLCLNA